MTALEIMTAAFRLIGVAATGEALSSEDSAVGLETLQTMLDAWSNQGLAVYGVTRETLSLTGATSYTIGSGGTLNTTRPVEILGAYVTSGGLDYPINIVSSRVYRDISQKSLSGTPQYIYYNPTYTLGYLYVYPVGTSSDTLTLDSLKPLTEPTTNASTMSFPPGYEEALIYNCAARMALKFGRVPDPVMLELASSSLLYLKSRSAAQRVEEAKLELLEVSRRYSIDGG